jgi:hypothetical protein
MWTQTLAGLGTETGDDLAVKAVQRLLAADLGNSELAARLSQQLATAGFDDPRFEPHGGERH